MQQSVCLLSTNSDINIIVQVANVMFVLAGLPFWTCYFINTISTVITIISLRPF